MEAREIFRRQYPRSRFPQMKFDEDLWDFSRRNVSPGNKNTKASFHRRRRGARDEPEALPEHFVGILKAWLVLSDTRASQCHSAAQAFRWLWMAIEDRSQGRAFRWSDVRDAHFEAAEALMVDHDLKRSSVTNFCRRLRKFIEWATEEGVLSPSVDWRPATKNDPGSTNADVRTERLDRLPRRQVLEALAEIYRVHAKAPRDRLVICAIGLCLVAGFRISELLSLPFDLVVREPDGKRTRIGLRYWRRKTKRGEFELSTRWLSPMGATLALGCIAEICRLTHGPRRRARILERDPKKVPLPSEFAKRKYLTSREVGSILCINSQSIPRTRKVSELEKRCLSPVGNTYSNHRYKRAAIEEILITRRAPMIVFRSNYGEEQWLSQTLLIEYPLTGNGSGFNKLLVQPIASHAIHSFLGGHENRTPSAFTRFGYNDDWLTTGDHERRHKARTHMFRHFINTVANKSGMTAMQITMWMQRKDEAQTMQYLHDSEEIAEIARDQIVNGELRGELPQLVRGLSEEEMPEALRAIEYAHHVKIGICLDQYLNPCPQAKACEVDCPSFAWNPNDQSKRAAIRQRRDSIAKSLATLQKRTKDQRTQPRQLEILERQLDAIEEKMLKGDRDNA